MRARRRGKKPAPLVGLLLFVLAAAGVGVIIAAVVSLARAPDAGSPSREAGAPGAAAVGGAGPVAMPAGVGTVDIHVEPPTQTASWRADAPCAGCDILVVTACSLRRDHVGAYGTFPGLTPAADRFARDGFRFERAYSASNFTLASLSAVLTGRFGSASGVTGWDKGLAEGVPTLPEILGLYGYRTGGFTVDAPSGFRPDYGLHRGFEVMQVVPTPRDTPDGRWRGGAIGPGGASAAPVEAWFASEPDDPRPRFTMFHTRSAHFPFVIDDSGAAADATGVTQGLWAAGREARATGQAMPGMAGGTAQQGVVEIGGTDPLELLLREGGAPAEAMWRQRYREAVGRMDTDLARVLAALEASGRADRTILVLVGDHGESLNDHGEMLHGDSYFNSVVNVPLLMAVPGLPGGGRAVPALVSHVDLLPTLLELVGGVAPAGIDGVSLVPLLRGDKEAVRSAALVEGGVARQREGVDPTGAVITAEWALLRQWRGCGGPTRRDHSGGPPGPPTCLFDQRDDFLQEHDVARDEPDRVSALIAMWTAYRTARGGASADVALSPELIDGLQRTGYDLQPASP